MPTLSPGRCYDGLNWCGSSRLFLQRLHVRKLKSCSYQIQSLPHPVIHLVRIDFLTIALDRVGTGYFGGQQFVPWIEAAKAGSDLLLPRC